MSQQVLTRDLSPLAWKRYCAVTVLVVHGAVLTAVVVALAGSGSEISQAFSLAGMFLVVACAAGAAGVLAQRDWGWATARWTSLAILLLMISSGSTGDLLSLYFLFRLTCFIATVWLYGYCRRSQRQARAGD